MDMIKHPHEFIPALHWCKVCGVTCRELHSAPLNSILWKECHIGAVAEYKRATGQLKRYVTRRLI